MRTNRLLQILSGVASLLALAVTATAGAVTAEGRLAIGDGELTYVSEGEGTPILFLHGALADLRAWEPYRERIARTHRFVAYTQRYFGTEPWGETEPDFSVERHVRDLIAVVEELGAGPVHLVTWSYGGEVGLQAMRDRPDLFLSGVHYEPYLPDLVHGLPGFGHAAAQVGARFGPADDAFARGALDEAALRVIEAVFDWSEGAADDASDAPMWIDNARTLPLQFGMAPYRPLNCGILGEIRLPSLIVEGSETLIRYAMMAERTAQCLGNAVVVSIPGVTHDGPYADPEAFGALIKAFSALSLQ